MFEAFLGIGLLRLDLLVVNTMVVENFVGQVLGTAFETKVARNAYTQPFSCNSQVLLERDIKQPIFSPSN